MCVRSFTIDTLSEAGAAHGFIRHWQCAPVHYSFIFMVPVRSSSLASSASRTAIEGSRLDWFFLSFLFVFTFPCLFCSEGVSDTDMSRVWLVLFMGRGIDTVVLDMWFCSWVVVSTRLSCSWVMVSMLSAPFCFYFSCCLFDSTSARGCVRVARICALLSSITCTTSCI